MYGHKIVFIIQKVVFQQVDGNFLVNKPDTNVGFTFNRLPTASGVSSTMFATPEDFVSPTGLDNFIVSFQ